ncbi:hypothetical protein SAMN05428987_2606 [Paenibacillus sp. CF095]|uniref:hypothetical protein n=1 Tax=Paenibacillus TaxID=44249 RepID=UPI00088F29E6|nr:hypothetical protein [Paenibacillus]PJN52914.1 hypothetical protein PAEAM_41160 [Paenibacillus sp. GM1FR]TDL68479.1 hypothetical protein E2R58_04555 [Paenibacillus amylolyticus]SDC75350.1 hypothetical protein SAMN05428987_2606 [Paenibacillus sp. CF095]
MNKNKGLIMSLLLLLILILLWNSFRTSIFEAVTVQKISENEMTVINFNNLERTIAVPMDMSKLIEENKEYTILYDKRVFDKYRLRSIKP